MRITRLLVAGFVLVLAGCSLLGRGKGHVSFYGDPGYDEVSGELFFAAAFEPDGALGNEVTIEYEITRGSTFVTSGTAQADTYDDALGSWVTGDIRVALEQSVYAGKTITISLDPEDKLTSPWLLVDNRERTIEIP
jgi:hypothetical protein